MVLTLLDVMLERMGTRRIPGMMMLDMMSLMVLLGLVKLVGLMEVLPMLSLLVLVSSRELLPWMMVVLLASMQFDVVAGGCGDDDGAGDADGGGGDDGYGDVCVDGGGVVVVRRQGRTDLSVERIRGVGI